MNGPRDAPRAGRLYHTLSSYGWYDEPISERGGDVEAVQPSVVDPGSLASLVDLLRARSSQREFTGEAITVDLLTAILWCGYGSVSDARSLRRATVPSAGGLYPLKLVVLPLAVESLARRVHVFDPAKARLVPTSELDTPPRVEDWFRTHHVDYGTAAAVCMIMADIDRPSARYGDRGYRYVLLEAGHVAQNICLAVTSTGLGAVTLGGFDDDVANTSLRPVVGDRVTLYALAIGSLGSPGHPDSVSRVIDSIRSR